MQPDEKFDDLTRLFEAQDETVQSDAFVERVMQPIRKRSRWRAPLLFGAGGLGIGAALSQIGGLLDAVDLPTANLSFSFDSVETPTWEIMVGSPLWVGAIMVVIVSCAAIIATERA